ncbi:MAG TPA: vanadium-dependent haloperoxidase [Anaerolineae bacterium]|nr:vanadium-dependent haloperoxidase [Anaerolineae bacterium]
MQGNRFSLLVSLVVIFGLTLTACWPGAVGQPRRGDEPAVVQAAVQIESTPLNTPLFGAPAGDVEGTQQLLPQATPTPLPETSAQAAGASAAAEDSDAAVPAAWFDLAYRLARDEKLPPPLASRLFGYAGVGLYEAVAPGIPGAASLAGQLNELAALPQPDAPAEYHWPAVANAALATLFRTLLTGASGETQLAIMELERRFEDEFAVVAGPEVLQRSRAQGQSVGLAVFDWAQADGFAYLNNCAYTPPSGPGLWQPTPPGYASPLQPCWGQMRPFVLRERSDECQPPAAATPIYSEEPSSPFFFEALEVYQTVQNLTLEQAEVARFWADDVGKTGTPPGHNISVLTQIVRERGLALDAAAEAYARLGVGLADSFISCWQTKFVTSIPRPVTYINDLIDPAWTSPVVTPPFPEYTSGHSVQSGAAAAVLTALFGDDFAITDHTHDALGYAPRPFPSFQAMAAEAAISRLYGGIHYRSAIEVGLEQGACIGERVNALQLRP